MYLQGKLSLYLDLEESYFSFAFGVKCIAQGQNVATGKQAFLFLFFFYYFFQFITV